MGALCCKAEVIDFDGPVDLYHFYLLRAVGKGAFGKVRVVQHKQTKALYALKYINKAKCVKMRAVSNIIQERRLLEEIESNFICNLRYAFQDDENLFMVLDLMLGGDLRFHLDRSGNMKEDVVRFYVAELAIGLDYLHKLQIVHRDLKPDNVLLDEKGHAHLTDFNIAVHFSHRRPLTSVAGSMAYMAPEVLAKRGYLSSVDWWSLGVMTYELLFGRRPFRGRTNSGLTNSILFDKCSFPENVGTIVSPQATSCIRGLLERDTKKRLGCKAGIDDFKAHPWFAGMDWQALENKEVTPPFEPDNKKANFDATHELEELLLEDNPLKAKKRDERRDIATLTPELRQMEEHFLPFDHLKQVRKSYFRHSRRDRAQRQGDRGDRDDGESMSQASSIAYTLADQPLAEMGQGGGGTSRGAGVGTGVASATSSFKGTPINGHGPGSGTFAGPSSSFAGRPSMGDAVYGGNSGAPSPAAHENGTWDKGFINGSMHQTAASGPASASTSAAPAPSGYTRRGDPNGASPVGHGPSASQEYMRAYKAQFQQNDLPKTSSAGALSGAGPGLAPSAKDSYPMQTMNETGDGTAF